MKHLAGTRPGRGGSQPAAARLAAASTRAGAGIGLGVDPHEPRIDEEQARLAERLGTDEILAQASTRATTLGRICLERVASGHADESTGIHFK